MPRVKHQQSLARQWELLKRLPAKGPGATTRELVAWLQNEGYPATKRTVERDLVDLSNLFPLTCNDKGIPYGWHWMEGQGADLPGLTVADAVSLSLVEELLRPLLPAAILESLEPRFTQARKKLQSHTSDSPNARWADKVRHTPPTLPLLPPKIADRVLEAVQDALLSDLQLDVGYQQPGEEKTHQVRLHPLGLVQRGHVTYLVATAFDYEDIRIYAVHRIQSATKTAERASRPEGFSLDDYIAGGALAFGTGAMIKLEATVSEELAAILAETPLSANQCLKKNKDKTSRLTASICNSWQLHWWILSNCDNFTVQKPLRLRNALAESVSIAAQNYKGDTP